MQEGYRLKIPELEIDRILSPNDIVGHGCIDLFTAELEKTQIKIFTQEYKFNNKSQGLKIFDEAGIENQIFVFETSDDMKVNTNFEYLYCLNKKIKPNMMVYKQ